jgi:hypothetical protein
MLLAITEILVAWACIAELAMVSASILPRFSPRRTSHCPTGAMMRRAIFTGRKLFLQFD